MRPTKAIQIGANSVGGPFGAQSGLIVGSIFYDNHSLVTDVMAGDIRQDRATHRIEQVTALACRYGVQLGLDVIAASSMAMQKYLPFVSSRTTLPLLINATEAEVRIAGLEAASKLGILERCIFASLNEDTEDEEIEALGQHRPAAVMVLASDITDPTPEGTCQMLESTFQPMLREINVETPIVDVGTMDAPSIGLNLRQIAAVREHFGYPAGCAFSNCFSQWPALTRLGLRWVDLSLAAALVACRGAGADFLHFGIIEKATMAAHVTATTEIFHGFAAKELDGQDLPREHALWKMFEH